MRHTSGTVARLAATVAVLTAVTLIGTATPAAADDGKPDLSVSFSSDPVAEINTLGTTIGMYIYNYGQAEPQAG